MIRRPPRSTQSRSSAASDVYKRQRETHDVVAESTEVAGETHLGAFDLSLAAVPAQLCDDLPGLSNTGRSHGMATPFEATTHIDGDLPAERRLASVSYTHLTLPTIY